MKKGDTIKRLKYISIGIATIIFLAYTSSLLLRIDVIQHQVAERIAQGIRESVDQPLQMGTVRVRHFNKLEISDILLNDQQGDTMICVKKLTLHISPLQLLREKIRVNTITLAKPDIRIYRENPESKCNIDFLFALFASDDSTSTPPRISELKVNQLQIYDGKVSYNVLSDTACNEGFDKSHIALSDISTNVSLKRLNSDTVSLYIRNITAKEKSGLHLKEFKARLNASRRGLRLERCRLRLPDSHLVTEKIELGYRWNKEKNVPENIVYTGEVDCKRINPMDLSALLPCIKGAPTLRITIKGKGEPQHTKIEELLVRDLNGDIEIEAAGNTKKEKEDAPEYNIEIRRCNVSQEGICSIYPLLPKDVASLDLHKKTGAISLDGNIHIRGKEVAGKAHITTENGAFNSTITSDAKGNYHATATGEDVALDKIFDNNDLGLCNIQAVANGEYNSADKFSGKFESNITSLAYNNYKYKDIGIQGNFTEKTAAIDLKSEDNNLKAAVSLWCDNKKEKPHYKLKVDVDTLRMNELGFTEAKQKQEIAFHGELEFTGNDMDNSLFSANIYDFSLNTPDKNWVVRYLHLRDNILNDRRNFIIDSDIMQGYVTGFYKYTTLPNSVHRIIEKYLPSIASTKNSTEANNKFVFHLDIENSDLLSHILDLPITINEKSTITGDCDDSYNHFALSATLNNTNFAGRRYNRITVSGKSCEEEMLLTTSLTRPIKEPVTDDEITIETESKIARDTIRNNIRWSNTGLEANKGNVDVDIAINHSPQHEIDFSAHLKPSFIMHCDEAWTLGRSDIYSKEGKYHIRNFALQNRDKELHINGTIGENDDDCLTIDLKEIDIEQLMDIVNFHSVELGGIATGNIHLSSILKTLKLNSRLDVDGFKFEHGHMGNMTFNGRWDKEIEAILLKAEIENGNKVATSIDGFVSPAHDTLKIDVKAHDTNLDFLNYMISSIVSDVDGVFNGDLCVRGSLGNINLYGNVVPTGHLRLKPTNTTYHFVGDTLRLGHNIIAFNKFRIKDLHNNIGTIQGGVFHNCLRKFTCKFDIKADNMLAYYSPDFNNETFYGTAFVTGDIGISVDSAGVFVNANVRSDKGSKFIYNSAGPSGAADNNFITFVDRKQQRKASMASITAANNLLDDITSKMRLDFMIDVTPDMQLRVYTNTITDDYIDLYGSGPINAVYDEKEGFSMKGNLDLERGTYKFTLQDIFPKEFDIKNGSSLLFNGEPFDAKLNLKTIYTVPSVPLTDLSLTAERRKSVKVNCLMDITGTLASPTLSFGLELPDGNEEERELLANATSTQEQTNMQFIYLLGIGKFYTQDYNNSNTENQSSTAMESLISSTISGQLNNMFSQIIDNDNWSFSSNFTTSEKGWNSMEVEGMLSGRLLDNRLLINGNFGYRDNPLANKNFIGDFEVQWLLNKSGNISLKAYNKTNDRYFSKTTLTTQGAGILLKRDFNGWKFWKKDE